MQALVLVLNTYSAEYLVSRIKQILQNVNLDRFFNNATLRRNRVDQFLVSNRNLVSISQLSNFLNLSKNQFLVSQKLVFSQQKISFQLAVSDCPNHKNQFLVSSVKSIIADLAAPLIFAQIKKKLVFSQQSWMPKLQRLVFSQQSQIAQVYSLHQISIYF